MSALRDKTVRALVEHHVSSQIADRLHDVTTIYLQVDSLNVELEKAADANEEPFDLQEVKNALADACDELTRAREAVKLYLEDRAPRAPSAPPGIPFVESFTVRASPAVEARPAYADALNVLFHQLRDMLECKHPEPQVIDARELERCGVCGALRRRGDVWRPPARFSSLRELLDFVQSIQKSLWPIVVEADGRSPVAPLFEGQRVAIPVQTAIETDMRPGPRGAFIMGEPQFHIYDEQLESFYERQRRAAERLEKERTIVAQRSKDLAACLERARDVAAQIESRSDLSVATAEHVRDLSRIFVDVLELLFPNAGGAS